MRKQRAAPAECKKVKNAQEISAILKRLPEKDRLRLEGVIIGMDLAHKGDQRTTNGPSVNRPA